MTYLQTFSTRMSVQNRRQALLDADDRVAAGEVIPFIFILIILLVLPLFFGSATYHSLNNFLWWMRAWTPLVAAVTAVLYVPVAFQIAPIQLTGAAVEAMTTSPDSTIQLALPTKAERLYLFALPLAVDEARVSTKWKRTYHQQTRRRHSGRQHALFYRFIPHPDSRDSSA